MVNTSGSDQSMTVMSSPWHSSTLSSQSSLRSHHHDHRDDGQYQGQVLTTWSRKDFKIKSSFHALYQQERCMILVMAGEALIQENHLKVLQISCKYGNCCWHDILSFLVSNDLCNAYVLWQLINHLSSSASLRWSNQKHSLLHAPVKAANFRSFPDFYCVVQTKITF